MQPAAPGFRRGLHDYAGAFIEYSSGFVNTLYRLLKNTHLLRYAHPSSLRRTEKYASFLMISRALHLDVFDQPAEIYFFNNMCKGGYPAVTWRGR